MTNSSIKILLFIYVYVRLRMCDDLSWLVTTILVPKFGPLKQYNLSSTPTQSRYGAGLWKP